MTTKMTFKTAVVESPERQPRQFSARMEGKRSSGGGAATELEFEVFEFEVSWFEVFEF